MQRDSPLKSNWKKKLKMNIGFLCPRQVGTSNTFFVIFHRPATGKHIVKNHPGIDRSDLGLGWSAELVSLSVRRISRRIARRTAII